MWTLLFVCRFLSLKSRLPFVARFLSLLIFSMDFTIETDLSILSSDPKASSKQTKRFRKFSLTDQAKTERENGTFIERKNESLLLTAGNSRNCKRQRADKSRCDNDTANQPETPSFVEIICKACRKERKAKSGHCKQQSILNAFLCTKSVPTLAAAINTSHHSAGSRSVLDIGAVGHVLVCSVCRRVLAEQPAADVAAAAAAASPDSAAMAAAARRPPTGSGCPAIAKLRGYQRVARDKGVAWALSDREALALMAQPCSFCGRPAAVNPGGCNGINRLDHSVPYPLALPPPPTLSLPDPVPAVPERAVTPHWCQKDPFPSAARRGAGAAVRRGQRGAGVRGVQPRQAQPHGGGVRGGLSAPGHPGRPGRLRPTPGGLPRLPRAQGPQRVRRCWLGK